MKKLLPFVILFALAGCEDPTQPFDAKGFLSELDGPNVPTIKDTQMANAKAAEQQGEWAAAGQLYKQMLEKDPENKDLLVAFAETQRRTGEFDRAIALYDAVLKKDASVIGAKEGKGLALLSKGDFESPIELFEDVMKADGKRWKTLNALGILFAARSMHAEATQYFKQALEYSPGNTSIMNNMGLSQALDGQFDIAADTLLQAGALAVGSGIDRQRIDLNLALVYAISGKLENARAVAEQYYSGPQLHNNMGLYAHLAKDNQMSKAYLNMALTQSKVFYSKAWENLQEIAVDGQDASSPAAGKISPNTKRIKVNKQPK